MAGQSRKRLTGVSGSGLKGIAVCAMIIDHIAEVILLSLYHGGILEKTGLFVIVYTLMRCIGRLAFPIFAFLLTEGYIHTGNVKRYLLRLGAFALISEVPFDLAVFGKVVDYSMQNVFFTLFFGLCTMYLIEKWENRLILQILAASFGVVLSWGIRADYGGVGVILILAFYVFRYQKKEQMAFSAVVMVCMIERKWEICYLAALPLIKWYNGTRGKGGKYFGYWFYPVHLAVLAGIRMLI